MIPCDGRRMRSERYTLPFFDLDLKTSRRHMPETGEARRRCCDRCDKQATVR